MKVLKHALFISFISIITLALSACGGSSSSAGDSGFITVSIGDNDISEFDKAIFEISSVVILGDDDGQITILNEQRSIDFLALETVNEVLAETEVPAGNYSKIRLTVDSIELVKLDDEGLVEESIFVNLVANGKVDIVPRGNFTIAAESTLALDIDVDLEKSIKLTGTGSGRYIFRPVIFADIISTLHEGRVVRVEGEFESIEVEGLVDEEAFKICEPELMSDDDDVSETPSCRLVLVQENTGFFESDETLVPSALENFENGDNVVAYGLLLPAAFVSDSDDHYGTPISSLVAARGDFSRLEGEAASTFAVETETFDFEPESGEVMIEGILPTLLPLSEGAILIDSEGQQVESSILDSGLEVEVEGLLFLGEPNSFEAFVAIVDTETDQVTLAGMATEIDIVARRLTLSDDTEDYCIELDDDTDIQLIDTTDEGVSVDSIALEALLNAEIEVTGELESDSDCLEAESIILDVTPIL